MLPLWSSFGKIIAPIIAPIIAFKGACALIRARAPLKAIIGPKLDQTGSKVESKAGPKLQLLLGFFSIIAPLFAIVIASTGEVLVHDLSYYCAI